MRWLTASHTPNLKVLTITGHSNNNVRPFVGLFLQLQELRIRPLLLTDELADDLETCCPNLQLLEVSLVEGLELSTLTDVVQAHVCLDELILHGLSLSHASEVAASFPNIRRLTFNGLSFAKGDTMEKIISLVGQHPNVSCVRSGYFAVSNIPNKLEVQS